MAADIIELRGLRVLAFCGILPEEVARRQPFELDLDVHADLRSAGRSDDLNDTIDYGALCGAVAALAEDRRFSLLERFAQEVADTVLAAAPRCTRVDVVVRKLRPPVPQLLESSGVRISRERAA